MISLYPYRSAVAHIRGNENAPNLHGTVHFHQHGAYVLVAADISGLPENNPSGFFAFHIHEGGSCEGAGFPETGGHFNPDALPHPRHAGDLPPLLSSKGKAYLAFLTDRFTVEDIIGRTVVIHSSSDDFRTQPSGNPGEKIGCGLIHAV